MGTDEIASRWFMVVSALKNLPVEMNIVPFMKISPNTKQPKPRIHLKCLPAGGFHHVKRVVHSGKGLRKCGYEKMCVMKNNETYDFKTNDQKKCQVTGTNKLAAETWGPN